MRAVGNYHSNTPPLKESYQAKVMRSADLLFGQWLDKVLIQLGLVTVRDLAPAADQPAAVETAATDCFVKN